MRTDSSLPTVGMQTLLLTPLYNFTAPARLSFYMYMNKQYEDDVGMVQVTEHPYPIVW